jgi:hypothetical protein
LILYLFSSFIPVRTVLLAVTTFILITLCFSGAFGTNTLLVSGYLFALLIAGFLLKKLIWPLRILAPLAIHLIGAIGLAICFKIEKLSLAEYINALKVLSLNSLIAELLLIYPLSLLSDRLGKLLNWCKFFE